MPRRLLVILGLVIAALVPGSAAADHGTTAVGKVRGTEAFLAVMSDGKRLHAYACNGSARRLPTISAWFDAPWDGRSRISVTSGGVELEIERVHTDGRISGRLDGHRFSLRPATGPAGLYDSNDGTTRKTSVVLANGDIRGVTIDPRPRKCRAVLVTTASGTAQYVTVCR